MKDRCGESNSRAGLIPGVTDPHEIKQPDMILLLASKEVPVKIQAPWVPPPCSFSFIMLPAGWRGFPRQRHNHKT